MVSTTTEALLRLPDVEARTGLSRSQLYAMVRAKQFPAPIPLAPNSRARAWIGSEVAAWIEQRIASARTPAAGGAA